MCVDVLGKQVVDYDDYDVQKHLIGLIPHRYPFLFVDKVIDLDRGKSIKVIKNVSNNENFFTGHFPEDRILPGVVILEFIAQAAAICMLSSFSENAGSSVFLTGVEEAKFKKMVRPGDVIRAEVELVKSRAPIWVFHGKVFDGMQQANQKIIASAVIKAAS